MAGQDKTVADASGAEAMRGQDGPLVLVTGGGGYVGSHCVLELLLAGYKVTVIDNFSNSTKGPDGQPVSLARVQELAGRSLTFLEADLRDLASLQRAFTRAQAGGATISCVLHFAALKSVAESCSLPLKYYTNNVTGSANLLEVMLQFGVEKVVFSSSATVYGQPQYLPVDELHPTGHCANPYGRTKLFTEQMMEDVCTANPSWACTLLRYFNPVGAHPSGRLGEDPLEEPNNLMPYVAQVAMGRRELLSIYGSDWDTEDGTGCRDYIHVTDLAHGHTAAVRQILGQGHQGCRTYNLGTGRGTTVLQLVKAFRAASGRDIPYRMVGRRTGDIATCFASSELAQKELGWKAEKTIEDCCSTEFNWQVKNPKGYKQ